MANAKGKCVICGASPTVKAHLFPRALMLDMRDGEPQLVSGHRAEPGLRLKQNGDWDDRILCDTHEKIIGSADDYGVRFCRNLSRAARPYPRPLFVSNSGPDELLRFAYATVWRHAVAWHGRKFGPKLGPFESVIVGELLTGGPYSLELVLGVSPLTLHGKPVTVAIPPYRERMTKFNIVHFTVGGVDFYLKTDGQSFPSGFGPYLANGNNPVFLSQIPEIPIADVRKLRPIFQQMSKSTWNPPTP